MIPKIIVETREAMQTAMQNEAAALVEESGVKDKVMLAFPGAHSLIICSTRQGARNIEIPFTALYCAVARAQAIEIIRGAV